MLSEHTEESTLESEVLLAAPRLSSAGMGPFPPPPCTQPFDRVVCGRPDTGHLVLCGALCWPERGLHARWESKVGEERAWYLRSVVLGLRNQDFGDAT